MFVSCVRAGEAKRCGRRFGAEVPFFAGTRVLSFLGSEMDYGSVVAAQVQGFQGNAIAKALSAS